MGEFCSYFEFFNSFIELSLLEDLLNYLILSKPSKLILESESSKTSITTYFPLV